MQSKNAVVRFCWKIFLLCIMVFLVEEACTKTQKEEINPEVAVNIPVDSSRCQTNLDIFPDFPVYCEICNTIYEMEMDQNFRDEAIETLVNDYFQETGSDSELESVRQIAEDTFQENICIAVSQTVCNFEKCVLDLPAELQQPVRVAIISMEFKILMQQEEVKYNLNDFYENLEHYLKEVLNEKDLETFKTCTHKMFDDMEK